MTRFKAVAVTLCLSGILYSNIVVQASETQTLEQAFLKCKAR